MNTRPQPEAARTATRQLATKIIQALNNNEALPIAPAQVEPVLIQLAQEITRLTEDRHANEATPAPARPLVGICVLVTKQGKLLLGKRRGSHGDGEYAAPGGHLEHLESFQSCAEREVLEETGIEIGPVRFLRVLNSASYAPRHYVDLAFTAEWQAGEPAAREEHKVESWAWYDADALPSPLFAMIPSGVAALLNRGSTCEDLT